MKRFFYSLIAASIFLGTYAYASTSIEVPTEVSALLQDANYQQILSQIKQQARASGHTLHIVGFSTLDLSPAKYIYINLATSVTSDVMHELTPLGVIVGLVFYGSLGEVGFDGVYFKPAGEGPGGASVGNQ